MSMAATKPLPNGSLVAWSEDAPSSWRFIWTPSPMTIVSARWDDGNPTEFSQIFGGIPRTPGWIVTVEYDPDSTNYYDPPLSLLLNAKKFRAEVHEMWLVLSERTSQPNEGDQTC